VDILILIALGTQDKQFYRLLEAVQKQIDDGKIKDEVIVQAGCSSKFKSNNMKIFDLIPMDEFDKLIKKCDVLITHGGVATIITGLKYNKRVIAAPRLRKYREHVNDHQLQIIDSFADLGYILPLYNFDELYNVIEESKKFKPKKYKSNTENFLKLIKNEIN